MSDQRNTILAVVLSAAVMIAWLVLMPQPVPQPDPATVEAGAAAPADTAALPQVAAQEALARDIAIAKSPRVAFKAPRIDGSISLTGALIDDVRLRDYEVTPKAGGCKDPEALDRERRKGHFNAEGYDPVSCEIIVMSPLGSNNAYYAEFGWQAPAGSAAKVPTRDTLWTLESGTVLAPGAPVTLAFDNGAGLIFRQRISVDDNYMFGVVQSVENVGSAATSLQPYGRIARRGQPLITNIWILHEGLLGVFDTTLQERKYKAMREEGTFTKQSAGGWVGITDKYWLTALVPDQTTQVTGSFAYTGTQTDIYQAVIQQGPVQIAPGAKVEVGSHFFAGAKEVQVIDTYGKELGIHRFDLAVDWGWFWFLTKPMFLLLDMIQNFVGNFGVAILIITVIVKLIFFPLANRSYETMSKMKKIQPLMKEMQDRYKDDRVKLQQEMMELYRKEKVNPLAGCLPIFIQIPVFFSLYKVLFVTIEMRHAPFFGWIQDLSAPDPTSIFNLFGLLPFDPSAVPYLGALLVIGAWPILMGVTMHLQTALNPAPQDPTQKMVFALMPFIFTVMLASFPAGLVIYWAWNNTLSIAQQYVIMKRNGTEVSLTKTLGFDRVAAGVRMLTNRKSDKTG